MVVHSSTVIQTEDYNAFVLITDKVEAAVAESGITEGMVFVISDHTTTGIMVNESLECLESDIAVLLGKLAPEDYPYSHARVLDSYGATAGNPTGHLKSLLTGYNCMFQVSGGKLARGSAQDVYLLEFDGPARRGIRFTVIGE